MLDVGNVNWKVIFNFEMRDMIIFFYMLVDGLVYFFCLNMLRWCDGFFGWGFDILFFISLKRCLFFFVVKSCMWNFRE